MLGLLGVACGSTADPCGDGIAGPGEVCFQAGPRLQGERAQDLMDFDGDGIADLASWHESFVRFLHNRGDATFEPVGDVPYDALGGPPIVLNDIDGDGVDELGVIDGAITEGPRDLWVHERDPDGTLRLEHTLHLPWSMSGMTDVAGDFDGDGDRDILLYAHDVVVLVPRVEGGFAEPIAIEPFGIDAQGWADLLVGDLDGDGADEVCKPWGDALRVRRGPELSMEESLAWPNAYEAAEIGDVDGDGVAEVVAYRTEAGRVRVSVDVLEHAGPGEALRLVEALDVEGAWVSLVDLNGDGMDDLLVPGEEVDPSPRYEPAYYGESGRVCLASGGGAFEPPVEISGLNAADWRPAHLDDDGALDLASFTLSWGCGLPECWAYGEPLLFRP